MTGATGWLSAAGEIAIQLLGVPLPVVIGATAGALLARGAQDPVPFGKAVIRTGLWIIVGCVCAQGAQAVIGWGMGKELPVGVLGFSALLICLLGPRLLPILQEQAPQLLKRWISKVGGSDAPPK